MKWTPIPALYWEQVLNGMHTSTDQIYIQQTKDSARWSTFEGYSKGWKSAAFLSSLFYLIFLCFHWLSDMAYRQEEENEASLWSWLASIHRGSFVLEAFNLIWLTWNRDSTTCKVVKYVCLFRTGRMGDSLHHKCAHLPWCLTWSLYIKTLHIKDNCERAYTYSQPFPKKEGFIIMSSGK